MPERCPICDQDECGHSAEEKTIREQGDRIAMLEGAIEGWRSRVADLERQRDDLQGANTREVERRRVAESDLATIRAALRDSATVRVNILRGDIALSRESALSIGGFDQLRETIRSLASGDTGGGERDRLDAILAIVEGR